MKNTAGSTPIIGIVPSFDDGVIISAGGQGIERIYLRRDYLQSIAAVGAIPFIVSPEVPLDAVIEMCDGIVISGGLDIDPKEYGEEALPELRAVEPSARFAWEKQLIEACDENGVPILGTCYGLQRLNVHYGGSLIQDIPHELGSEAIGHDNTRHPVHFKREFLGFHPDEERTVASRHHQALARLADNISIAAVAPDGIIEAAHFGNIHFGMQWHPESDETGAHVYRMFVESCMVK